MAKPEPTVVGRNLRRLRVKHGLSQMALADAAGVAQPDVSRIERGETRDPAAGILKRIADSLGEDIREFWAHEDAESAAVADKSLRAFLASPLAEGVTNDEIEELRAMRWPWGPPTIRGWYHALEAMRATRRI